ncbi:hypothetical protein PABG_06921 [Paracoccidioides brasiliensis Pb03]|nr:hypothetical protein PABG_06921 [Paracoccidioides brasiliensis Pb03]
MRGSTTRNADDRFDCWAETFDCALNSLVAGMWADHGDHGNWKDGITRHQVITRAYTEGKEGYQTLYCAQYTTITQTSSFNRRGERLQEEAEADCWDVLYLKFAPQSFPRPTPSYNNSEYLLCLAFSGLVGLHLAYRKRLLLFRGQTRKDPPYIRFKSMRQFQNHPSSFSHTLFQGPGNIKNGRMP